eukprot:s3545_g2.t3
MALRLFALAFLVLAGAQLPDDECDDQSSSGQDCALNALQRDARRMESTEGRVERVFLVSECPPPEEITSVSFSQFVPSQLVMSCCCCSCVDTGSVGVVQKFGEYQGVQEPGCSCICWPITTVDPVSLAVRQQECKSDCKTKDNVTVTVVTACQFRVQKDMVKQIQRRLESSTIASVDQCGALLWGVAHFDIADPFNQIAAEVDSVLRSTLPTMTLDESYEAKEKMVNEILASVREAMGKYGYDIINVLITDIRPERSVMDAMNEINASRRQREAAFERGEAEKLLKIKASEADAEAKRLAGVGMANMRAAMAQGFQDSMKFMKESGMSEKEAMHMMIMTQYLDTLKEFANSHGSIVVPHGPSAVGDLQGQIRDGFLQAASQQKMAGGIFG